MEEVPLPGTALADELDKKLLIQLRDGRKIIGYLRSFDQFANLVIDEAHERLIAGEQYCDCPLGVQLIRGENVVLLGEIDLEKELPEGLTAVSELEIKTAIKAERDMNRMKATLRYH
jgi:U6 snRNA-associated Sm-like protein LSm1